MLDNKVRQPSKLRTKNWVEINDDSRGTYSTTGKFTALKSSFHSYSDAYIHVTGTMSVTNTAVARSDVNNNSK